MVDPNKNAGSSDKTIDVLLDEGRTFESSKEFAKQANFSDRAIYDEAGKDPVAFWEKCASHLDWFQKWDKALEWNAPDAKWFLGGKLKASASSTRS